MQLSLFDQPVRVADHTPSNDYHLMPVTEKQVSLARRIAAKTQAPLPDDVLLDRSRLSQWIDTHKAARPEGRFADYPSSKQVAFAERIARIKRREVPRACFKDRALMSRWIDSNR